MLTTEAQAKADAQRIEARGEAEATREVNQALAEMSDGALQVRLAEIQAEALQELGPEDGTLILGDEVPYLLNGNPSSSQQ